MFSNCHSNFEEIIDKGISWARNYVRMSYPVFQYSPMVTVSHWSMPSKGWIKLNIDVTVSPNGYYAGIGGMFRDTDANWLW